MIGPPALKFRMKKFELGASAGAGAGLVSAATVAVTAGVATAAGEPAAAVAAGLPASGATAGATVVPGAATDAPGAAASGDVERAGEVSDAAGGLIAGLIAGGAAGLCAKLVSTTLREQRLTISVFFIFSRVDGGQKIRRLVLPLFIPKKIAARPDKTFLNPGPALHLFLLIRIHWCVGM